MSDIDDSLGTAVIVRGCIVAWFRDFDDAAHEWCTENFFGQWLTWRANPPAMVPLTPEELIRVELRVKDLREKLQIE